jgi:hypothetical protein
MIEYLPLVTVGATIVYAYVSDVYEEFLRKAGF